MPGSGPSLRTFRLLATLEGTGVEAWVVAEGAGEPAALWLVRADGDDEDALVDRLDADAAALRAARIAGAPAAVVRLDAGIGVTFSLPDGESSLDRLQVGLGVLGERLPVRAALELGAQVADALRAAHTLEVDGAPHPVVHGDLRPAAVRVSRVGRVRVVGFGVSRTTRRPRPRAATAGLVPAEAWCAPEAVLAGDEQPAIDVFSAALLAIEAVCGRTLGPAPGRSGPHDAWREAVLDAADGRCGPATAVVRRALAWSPAERPSAAELANALDDASRPLRGEGLAVFLGRVSPRLAALPTPITPATGALHERRPAPAAPPRRPVGWLGWVAGLSAAAAVSATCGAGSLLAVTALDARVRSRPAGVAIVEVPGAARVTVACGGARVAADGERLELDAVGRGQCDVTARVGDRTFVSPAPIGPGVHVRCAPRPGGIDCRSVRPPESASGPERSHGG